VDETGDMPWLEHTICTPLTERDTRRLERELRRPLPPALRALYRDCTRGVNLLGHDLSIYGFRTGLLPDPYDLATETLVVPDGAGADDVFFGSVGPENAMLYLDADERVHLSALHATRPLRSWDDLGQFLVSILEEGLRCWDAEGRRVADLPLPEDTSEPAPPAHRPLHVPEGYEARAGEVRELLADAPDTIEHDEVTYELVEPDELGDMQVGYSVTEDGRSLTGDADGDWRPTWIVIGTEELTGDPLFVDLDTPHLAVYTAMHGMGDWDPDQLVDALGAALRRR